MFRDEYLRAGPGAPFTVVPTGNVDMPYMLRNEYENSRPLIRWGKFVASWHIVFTLLPPGLWYFVFVRPWLTALPDQRDSKMAAVPGNLMLSVMLGLAFLLIVFLKRD